MKAIAAYQQSLQIAREIRDRRSEGNTLNNLGAIYYRQGNYAKAIEVMEQDLAIARELKTVRVSEKHSPIWVWHTEHWAILQKPLPMNCKVLRWHER